MRLKLGRSGCFAVAAAIMAGASAMPASAGGYHDYIYADSYGNLVIHSRAGYKRIIVGAGHLARELAGYERTGDEDVVYLDEEPTGGVERDCYRPPVLVKGRSYMYGFDQGEIPLQGGPCR